MEQRRIAFVGLERHTIRACLSMLGIMANSAAVKWQECAVDDADVLMVDRHKTANLPNNVPRIIVHPGTETKPSTRYTLSRPFRAMQLIELLETIHEQQHPSPVEQPKPDADCLPQWQHITDITCQQPPQQGVVPCHTNIGTFYIEPCTRTFYADNNTIEQLETTPVVVDAIHERLAQAPSNLLQKPVFLLTWHLASQVKGLLPCLTDVTTFHLKRWPYLTALPRSRDRLTLCALLSKKPISYHQLNQLTQCDSSTIDQFLNASLISGLLHTETAAQPVQVASPQKPPKKRFGNVIRSLRFRLGLSS